METRLLKCLDIVRDITDLGVPSDYPPLKQLSKRLSDYVKSGESWSGRIMFEEYGRYADIVLPSRHDRDIQVVLRNINR